MYSKVKIFGHPLHVMLVAYPIAFYTATFVCFAIYGANHNPFWFKVAYASNVAGVVMAAVAALPGFIDWAIGIPNKTPAKSTGLTHMLFNVTALVVFAINLYLQSGKWNNPQPDDAGAFWLSLIGVVITVAAGFYGWTLVQRHHVGVELLPSEEKILV